MSNTELGERGGINYYLMKKSIILFFITLLLLTSCTQKDVELKLTAIAFDSTQVIIGVSESTTLTLKQIPANLPAPLLTWVSLSPDIATVDANGVVKGVGIGTAKIKVCSQSDQSINTTCNVVKTRGTSELPYLINTVQDLIQMRDRVNNDNANYGNKVYKIMADLDFSNEASWLPIGSSDKIPFTGIFDGNGKVIKNIRIGTQSSSVSLGYAGLFGNIIGGDILNLGIQWSCLNSNSTTGGIVGNLSGGTISNCFSTGLILGGRPAAGIAGYIDQGTISNCYSSCAITSTSINDTWCGGIVGCVLNNSGNGGLVANCIALNTSLIAITLTNNSYPKRIANFTDAGSASNNYASTSIIVKKGTSASNLTIITSFTNTKNDGANLIGNPIDLLNAYVTTNRTINGVTLSKWKVDASINNGCPVFQ